MKKNKDKRRTILLIANSFKGGGAESVARLMGEQLQDSVKVLFVGNKSKSLRDGNLYIVGKSRKNNVLQKIVLNCYRVIYVQVIKLIVRPELTVSHLEGSNIANLMTLLGGRRVIFVHNLISRNYEHRNCRNALLLYFVRRLYMKADLVVGVSPDICSELENNYQVPGNKSVFIPNPISASKVETEAMTGMSAIDRELCRGRYLVNVASLTKQKNHQLLMRVFKELQRDEQNIKLLLVGDGEDRSKIIELCGQLGIVICDTSVRPYNPSAKVFLMGFQNNPYPYIQQAECLIMPSLWEGLPVAILEALALGTPLIVSNCSQGIREVICNGDQPIWAEDQGRRCRTNYGFLMREYDNNDTTVKVWSRAIKELIFDKKYMEICSIEGKKRSQMYDISKVEEVWKEKIFFHTM